MVDTERTGIYGNRQLAQLMVHDEIDGFLFNQPGHYTVDIPGYLVSLRARLTSPEGKQLFSGAFTEYTAGDSFGSMVMEAEGSRVRVNQQGVLEEVIKELDRRLGRPLPSGMG